MSRRFARSRRRVFALHLLAIVVAASAIGCGRSTAPSRGGPATAATVTFNHDVAPIVFAHCSQCHHPGAAAPFSLLTYDDVRRRARQIVDVTHKRFMPPWLPAEGDETFVAARRLSDNDLQLLHDWVEADCPLGDASGAPAMPQFAAGWQAGAPDLVLETPAFALGAGGSDVFRNFVVPLQLGGSRWVSAIELQPANPRVTHHARLGVDSTGESLRRRADDGQPGYPGTAWGQDPDGQFVIWAPGMVARPGTPGVAWRLDPNTCLVLHTHMQPSGKSETVQYQIGVHFADGPPTTRPVILRVGSCDVDIPAGAAHHMVTGEYVTPVDLELQMIFPHAHSLCTELAVTAERPDGATQSLITIPHFDENWHEAYYYRRPVILPRGTRLRSRFAYDNTDDNLRNRNHPARRTVYGSNVTDEMADVYVQVRPVHADERAALLEQFKRYDVQAQIVGLRNGLKMHADDPWLQEGLAACYMGLGKPDEAISILKQRLTTGPKDAFPMASLGMARLARGDMAQAEQAERDALGIDDKYSLAWLGLGKALVAEKKGQPAADAFSRAVELAPGLLDARLELADLLVRAGQLDDAARICAAAVSDSPDIAPVFTKLAEISAKQKKYDDSLTYCQAARRLAPYAHPPKVILAVYCYQNGDEKKALELLNAARAEAPTYPMTPLLLGQLARRGDRLDEARRDLAEAAADPIPENWPDSHRQRFLVLLHSERFQLAQQLHDTASARDALTQWLKCDPENREVRRLYDELGAADVK